MTIRPATTADVPEIVTLLLRFRALSPYHVWLAESSAQLAATTQQMIAGSDSDVLVLEDRSGSVVGVLGVVAAAHHISGERMASEVFWWVEPDARGRASLDLLHAAEAWAQQQGALWMQMVAPDPRVEALYTRFGYVPMERTFIRRLDAV